MADPDVAARVMNDLAEKNELTAEKLVEVSKPEDAPLHKDFEWDDTVAAQEYRKMQGRHIINSLIIVPEVEEKEPIRAFFKIETHENTYTPIQTIIRCPTSREILLMNAFAELKAFRKKYESLSELVKVFAAIDEATAKEA